MPRERRSPWKSSVFPFKKKESTGVAPLAWLVRERIDLAARLLETRPALGIDAVADLAGLGSAESLRRHFRTHGLLPPARYRKQVAGATAD
jgi:AraC family transcriptional activator FtrA